MLFICNNERARRAKITWLTNETLHTREEPCLNCSHTVQPIVPELLGPPLQLRRQNQSRDPNLPKGFSQIIPTRDFKVSETLSHLEVTWCREMASLVNLRLSEHITEFNKEYWMLYEQSSRGCSRGWPYVRYGPTGFLSIRIKYMTTLSYKIVAHVLLYNCCL